MNIRFASIALLLWTFSTAFGEIEVISFSPPSGMIRAEVAYLKPDKRPKGFLVLCPGYNGDGAYLIGKKEWQKFADDNGLILIGLSFASDVEKLHDGTGYYYPEHGSGKALIKALKKIHNEDLPIYMYGFSGGAHFTSRFAEWAPRKVNAFAAYSAGWWTKPSKKRKNMPPGIIACGSKDERLGASHSYFLDGRALDRPWLWVELPDIGHKEYAPLDDFVRAFFSSVMHSNSKSVWIDILTGEQKRGSFAMDAKSVTGYIPDGSLVGKWKELCGAK